MTKECIILLCDETELNRERKGYYNAFSKIMPVFCIPPETINIDKIISLKSAEGLKPLIALHPEGSYTLPQNIENFQVPTACFQIDTYNAPLSRLKWSKLFDYVFVFHPKFDELFREHGHPKSICLPHAVEADIFQNLKESRIYDIGWVGSLVGRIYSLRRKYIQSLSQKYKMNDIDRYYQPSEMANIYMQSKIVVNISRDDYPQDANLRCFEVMASGALLITTKPTELEYFGFIEGDHYITFKSRNELHNKLDFYIQNEPERERISSNARLLVLDKHTYDQRAQTIVNVLNRDQGSLFAPARRWQKLDISKVYYDYYVKHLKLDPAIHTLNRIREISIFEYIKLLPILMKAFIRSIQTFK